MVMMAVEKTWEQLMTSYENYEGKGQGQEEDPAALDGTFKRYKQRDKTVADHVYCIYVLIQFIMLITS